MRTRAVTSRGSGMVYNHVWYWRKQEAPGRIVDRKGQRCRVVARGRRNSVLVEFEDGYRVITSRYAVRRASNPDRATLQATLFPKA